MLSQRNLISIQHKYERGHLKKCIERLIHHSTSAQFFQNLVIDWHPKIELFFSPKNVVIFYTQKFFYLLHPQQITIIQTHLTPVLKYLGNIGTLQNKTTKVLKQKKISSAMSMTPQSRKQIWGHLTNLVPFFGGRKRQISFTIQSTIFL